MPDVPEPAALSTEASPEATPPASEAPRPLAETESYLGLLFRTNKWPGWALVLFSIFTLVPDWQGRLMFWIGALHTVGGIAAMLVDAIPLIGFLAGVAGVLYITAVVWQENITPAAAWVPLAGWTLFIFFLLTFGSLSLFAGFVVSSKIPEAVQFVERQSEPRYITAEQKGKLKDVLGNIKENIPPFKVISGRDPENLQYAGMLITALKQAGLKIIKDGREQNTPEAVDIYDTRWVGVLVITKYREAPSRPAVLLHDAFNSAGIKAIYLSENDGPDDTLLVMVGLK
jgi:hypothetical protein